MSSTSRRRQLNLDGSDHMSCLPDHLLQHILFYVPLQDAITVSSLSKYWLHAWRTLSTFIYHFNHVNASGDITLEEFVNFVDDSLSALKERRVFINSFLLHMDLNPTQEGLNLVFDRFDDWVSLILKNYVEDIDIRISNSDVFYTLPRALFASRSLVKLHLESCSFPPDLLFPFHNCLKVLCLKNILAEEDQIQKLVDLSRKFLEKLIVIACPNVGVLQVSNFAKLCYVEVNVRVLHVCLAPKLETLVMYRISRVTCANCPNITTLKCWDWDTRNEAYKYIQEMISNLPLLETLLLSMSQNEKITVQNHHLETLVLIEDQRFEEPLEVELDTPRLGTMYFSGIRIPFVNVTCDLLNVSGTLELHHFGHYDGGIDGFHLHELGMFSKNINHRCIEVSLHQIFTENMLTLEDLKQHFPSFSHASNVKKLMLECIPASLDYTPFLNCLFWTCHPSSLMVMLTHEDTRNSPSLTAFIVYLFKELMHWEQHRALTCCKERESPKCWRHYVEDVQCCVHRTTHEREPNELIHRLQQYGITFIETNTKGLILEFNFQWLQNPI